MANDIAVLWDATKQVGDIAFETGDLVREPGLTSAVILSLFLDARATDDSGIVDPDKKRGWWGDLLSDTQSNDIQTGSLLWLLSREKVTQRVLNLAEQYILDALRWMTEEGVVQTINVTVEQQGSIDTPVLAAKIELFFSDGDTQVITFSDLW